MGSGEILGCFFGALALFNITVYVVRRLLTDESQLVFDSYEEESRYRNTGQDNEDW